MKGEPLIIAEIGANFNGDIQLAKKLIEAAEQCGCDCAKFQSWSPNSLIAKEEYDRNQKYNDSPKKYFGSLREMAEKYYLRPEQHKELKRHCDKIGIDFASSVFSNEEADLLNEIDVPFFKVASTDVNNLELLKYVARYRRPIMLSTGMATGAEIKNAVRTLEGQGAKEIILLHCIALYPPEYKEINLNNIPMLKETFGYRVGFSDHSIGFSIPLAAVALGASVIEKHFTLDKDLPGWDHQISADPEEMRIIVAESKNIARALGSYERVVSEREEEKKLSFRRSIVAANFLPKGHILKNRDVLFKRPGRGIRPDELRQVIGRRLKHDIKEDDLLSWDDLAE